MGKIERLLGTPLLLECALWPVVLSSLVGLFPVHILPWLQVHHLCSLFCLVSECSCLVCELYHLLRGQSSIKLHVIYNICEMLDRMCCVFWRDPSELGSFPVVFWVLVGFHGLVLLVQCLSIHCCVNSNVSVLIALMVSCQFVELKSSVFKRFDQGAYTQLVETDAMQRI